MARTIALSALAAVVIATQWMRLERAPHATARVVVLVALAVLPALLHTRRLRAASLFVAVICAATIAFDLPLNSRFFHLLSSRFRGGFVDFYAYRLPVDPTVHGRMHMLLLAAVFVFSGVTAFAIAERRAIASVLCVLVGAGWPATLLGGGHPLARGAFILAVGMALLAGISKRVSLVAVPTAALVVVAAVSFSTSSAVAKGGLLDWQRWNPYAHPDKPVSVSFVWNGSYSGIQFPKKRTTVLTIDAPPTIGTYWRATVLEEYVGSRWVENIRKGADIEPATAGNSANDVRQQVTVAAFADRHLVGASLPIAYTGAPVRPLRRGERYAVLSYAPKPTPAQLVGSLPVYPRALTLPGRELEIAPGVDAPVFGTPNRAAILMQRLRGTLAPYRALFAKAQQVVGDTRDPYAAVVALERWFRASGGFVYSTQPPPTPGLPPLVGFTLETKTGYCQHFAGAMALMTRLLGIPARVAAGFVNGRYADGVWTITDHDAHTWVEVWFRGYGWLPFDPTPGRGYLAAAYSAASPHFDPVAEQKLLARVMRGGAVFGAGAHRVQSFIARNARPRGKAPHVRPGPATAGGSRAHSLVFLLALVVLGVIGAIAVAKLVRRRARYLTRDPRKVATACVRELSDFLVDQRLVVTRGLTIGDVGDELERRFAVSSEEFAAAVRAARFGPPARSRSAADNARKELAALKRRLRRRLLVGERIRGCVSLRSLGFS